jgi:ABC-type multidrug transport system ATPase subunit
VGKERAAADVQGRHALIEVRETWPLHEVGSLLDANALHPGRRARAHLMSVAQSNGVGRRRVEEVLELTGLSTVADRRARTYSLGMKQRLGIALALIGDPPVLVCDEPVSGLDAEGSSGPGSCSGASPPRAGPSSCQAT